MLNKGFNVECVGDDRRDKTRCMNQACNGEDFLFIFKLDYTIYCKKCGCKIKKTTKEFSLEDLWMNKRVSKEEYDLIKKGAKDIFEDDQCQKDPWLIKYEKEEEKRPRLWENDCNDDLDTSKIPDNWDENQPPGWN